MPIFITLTHGQSIIVKGESIPRRMLRLRTIRARALSGNQVVIRREAVSWMEWVPEEQYLKMREAAERARAEKKGGSGERQPGAAQPALTIPGGKR